MNYIPFNQIIDALEHLDGTQLQILQKLIEESNQPKSIKSKIHTDKLSTLDEIRESRFRDGLCCPLCQANGPFKKNGTFRDRQRYLCKTCKRTFNDLTNTPVHYTKHSGHTWTEYLKGMVQGLSIRKCAKLAGISVDTSFKWRHKILHALSEKKDQTLEGIVESDETYVLRSEKGKRGLERKPRKRGGKAKKRGISNEQVCILVARDRTKQTISEAVTFGRMATATLDAVITYRLGSNVILCTDEEQTFRKYCRDQGLRHEKVNPEKKRYVTKEIYHIQNVNAYHERFKSFLARYRGVASKYFNHYLAWHCMLDMNQSPEMIKVKCLFIQAINKPMKTNSKHISAYCEEQFQKLAV